MNDTRMFIDRRCGGLRIWMLLVLSCFVLGVPAQSIADLARKAEERKDPLHAYTNVGDFHYGMAVAQKKLPNGEPGEYWVWWTKRARCALLSNIVRYARRTISMTKTICMFAVRIAVMAL